MGNRIMRTLGRKSSKQWSKISYEGECSIYFHIVSNKLAREFSYAESKSKQKIAELSNFTCRNLQFTSSKR